jgi:NAD(P)-dependent dehydrogenase (short-subunit alcohol dehydrogenase family)
MLLITGTTGIAAAAAELARARGWTAVTIGLPDVDFTDAAATAEAVAKCEVDHGPIARLFHVAGASGRKWGDGPLDECTGDGWRKTLDANLTTCFHVTRAVLRSMMARRTGSIVLMSSVLARHPAHEHFATHAYAAAKGAVEALVRSSAAYYAAHGIRVNGIAPGLTNTPMAERARADAALLEQMKDKQPLAGGMLEPADVALAALFLLSDEARHITGQILTVDAGWSVL